MPDPSRPTLVVAPLTCQSGGTIEVFLEPFLPIAAHRLWPEPGQRRADSPWSRHGLSRGRGATGGTATAPEEADCARRSGRPMIVRGRRTVAVVASMGVYDEDAVGPRSSWSRVCRAGRQPQTLQSARDLLADAGTDRRPARTGKGAGRNRHFGQFSPEEIAVSILAEIISRRSRYRSRRRRVQQRPATSSLRSTLSVAWRSRSPEPTTSLDYHGRALFLLLSGLPAVVPERDPGEVSAGGVTSGRRSTATIHAYPRRFHVSVRATIARDPIPSLH